MHDSNFLSTLFLTGGYNNNDAEVTDPYIWGGGTE